MQFYSTKNRSLTVSLSQAVLQGLASDGGLFMPVEVPRLSSHVVNAMSRLNFKAIALEMARPYLAEDIPESALQNIIEHAFDFDAPLHPLNERLFVLELFHGPTLAFKDFGARFMARLMAWLRRNASKEVFILVATSGDTGSAVAQGFFNIPGFRVVLLYPSGRVSTIQEMQLTTLGGNVTALEIEGDFDDCQRLVKQAFVDKELQEKRDLSSANSINIARLIPQTFYYAAAWAQLPPSDRPVIVSVPSGNLGNLTAGVLAQRMGIPIRHFVAAMNVNDVFLDYLQKARFHPRPVISTLSNAMDVGNPSNFYRLWELFDHDSRTMRQKISGIRITDQETRAGIASVYEQWGYVLDPHGAVGFLALQRIVQRNNWHAWRQITLETAHAAKFKSVVETCIDHKITIPKRLKNVLEGQKRALRLSNKFEDFKQWLLAQ